MEEIQPLLKSKKVSTKKALKKDKNNSSSLTGYLCVETTTKRIGFYSKESWSKLIVFNIKTNQI